MSTIGLKSNSPVTTQTPHDDPHVARVDAILSEIREAMLADICFQSSHLAPAMQVSVSEDDGFRYAQYAIGDVTVWTIVTRKGND